MSKEVIRDSVQYLPAKVVPALVGIVSIPVLTRLLSPEAYGQYILAYTALSLIAALCIGWIVSVTLRFYVVYGRKKLHDTIRPLLSGSLILATLIWLGVSNALGNGISSDKMVVSGALWLIAYGMFEYLVAWLRVMKRPYLYGIAQSLRSAGGLFIATVILLLGFVDAATVIASMSFVMILVVLSLLKESMHVMNGYGCEDEQNNKAVMSVVMHYGIPAAITNFLIVSLSIIDRVIIEIYLGSSVVAVYAASYDLAEKTIFFLNSMLLLSSSVVGYRIYENEGEAKALKFLSNLMRLYLLVAPPLALFFIMYSKEVVAYLLPPTYSDGAVILPLVALGGIFVGVMHRYTLVLGFHKRTDRIMLAAIIALAVNVALCVVMVPEYGIVGGALSTLIAYAIWFVIIRILASKYRCPQFPWRTAVNVTFALILSGSCVYMATQFFDVKSIFIHLLVLSVGFFMYVTSLSIFGEFTISELLATAKSYYKKI